MNTGLEDEETLVFIDKCDKTWGLDLVWLEASVNPIQNKGTTYTVVSFDTACRDGRLFEDTIKKYGIPNANYPHCNRELKLRPYQKYTKALGIPFKTAIGIRVDEFDRMSTSADADGIIYPLIKMKPTRKEEIIAWWSGQDFDLDLPEHRGNCVTCWKKSDRKLMTLSIQDPQAFETFSRFEKEYPDAGSGDGGRVFYRGGKSTEDIFAQAQAPFSMFVDAIYKGEIDNENSCGGSTCDLFSQ